MTKVTNSKGSVFASFTLFRPFFISNSAVFIGVKIFLPPGAKYPSYATEQM